MLLLPPRPSPSVVVSRCSDQLVPDGVEVSDPLFLSSLTIYPSTPRRPVVPVAAQATALFAAWELGSCGRAHHIIECCFEELYSTQAERILSIHHP